jgi:hypothetical protein
VCSNPAALLMDRTTGPLEPRCTEADVHAPLLPTMAPAFCNVPALAVDMTRDPRCEIGTQEARVGYFICEPGDGSEAQPYGSEMITLFCEVDSASGV